MRKLCEIMGSRYNRVESDFRIPPPIDHSSHTPSLGRNTKIGKAGRVLCWILACVIFPFLKTKVLEKNLPMYGCDLLALSLE